MFNNKNHSIHPNKERVNKEMDFFTSSMSDLYRVTYQTIREVSEDKTPAFYGLAVIHPFQRKFFEREILIFFSDLHHEKITTIEIAKNFIEQNKNRLMSSILIIVHKDNNADKKLKEWGDNFSILVLPIFFDKNLSADHFRNIFIQFLTQV